MPLEACGISFNKIFLSVLCSSKIMEIKKIWTFWKRQIKPKD